MSAFESMTAHRIFTERRTKRVSLDYVDFLKLTMFAPSRATSLATTNNCIIEYDISQDPGSDATLNTVACPTLAWNHQKTSYECLERRKDA